MKMQPSRGVDLDSVTRGEMVEGELDAMIRRRDEARRKDEGERPLEALWRESVARYEEKNGQRRLWEWWRFHSGQAARHRKTLSSLIAHHEAEAQRLAQLLGIDGLDDELSPNGHHKESA